MAPASALSRQDDAVAIAAIKVPFAVVVIALLSRASALSSAARLATQKGPLGLSSRHLARQSVRAALANPLRRPALPLALPLGRSRRLLCSGGAPEAPPPARPPGCSLAPSAALERPQVDLLPISDEWKERLRSLTRPAASAMVRRLDAASPLCYRLDRDVAGVRDPLQLAAFAGDVERVEELLEREEGGALPSVMQKKLRGTAQAFLEARVAAEEAAAADGARASVPEALLHELTLREWTLVDRAQLWKWAHPEMLLLVRVGDFYEAFGVDAVMLVEHAGLNPMGGRCPRPNPEAQA